MWSLNAGLSATPCESVLFDTVEDWCLETEEDALEGRLFFGTVAELDCRSIDDECDNWVLDDALTGCPDDEENVFDGTSRPER